MPTLQLILQNSSTFLVDVTFHSMTVEDYNLTVVSLFHPYTRITLNNQSILELHAGVGPRYSFTLDYPICSTQGHKIFIFGKLSITLLTLTLLTMNIN